MYLKSQVSGFLKILMVRLIQHDAYTFIKCNFTIIYIPIRCEHLYKYCYLLTIIANEKVLIKSTEFGIRKSRINFHLCHVPIY